MSKRIDKKKREEIRRKARERSAHTEAGKQWLYSLAKELGVSPETILKWMSREDLNDKPRNPKGPPGLGDFGKVAFREMVRLTGYSRRRLFEYLAPVWGALPSQARESICGEHPRYVEPLTGKLCPKTLHPRTIRRAMTECGLGKFKLAQPDKAGTIAIHKVQIRWKDKDGSATAGELLLLLERNSGALYARAFTGRAKAADVDRCLKRFEKMLQKKTSKLLLVTPISGTPTPLGKFTVPVIEDPPSPMQTSRIDLPGIFASKHALNQLINAVVDRINLTDREYYDRHAQKIEMAPYKRFVRLLPARKKTPTTERRLKKRMRLLENEITHTPYHPVTPKNPDT